MGEGLRKTVDKLLAGAEVRLLQEELARGAAALEDLARSARLTLKLQCVLANIELSALEEARELTSEEKAAAAEEGSPEPSSPEPSVLQQSEEDLAGLERLEKEFTRRRGRAPRPEEDLEAGLEGIELGEVEPDSRRG